MGMSCRHNSSTINDHAKQLQFVLFDAVCHGRTLRTRPLTLIRNGEKTRATRIHSIQLLRTPPTPLTAEYLDTTQHHRDQVTMKSNTDIIKKGRTVVTE